MLIYKITNRLNGKIYVGQSIDDNPEYLGSGKLIKRSVEKYGVSNFKREVLEYCEKRELLNEREIYWIAKLNARDLSIGYNIASGGEGGDTFTNNPNKEHFLDYCRSRTGNKNGMYGRKHTKESIDKMRANRKGKRIGIPTWNKGKKCPQLGRPMNGRKNSNAKTFKLISPEGHEHLVVGSLANFCEEHELPFTTVWFYINKGKIEEPKRHHKEKRKNLTGWEIQKYQKGTH